MAAGPPDRALQRVPGRLPVRSPKWFLPNWGLPASPELVEAMQINFSKAGHPTARGYRRTPTARLTSTSDPKPPRARTRTECRPIPRGSSRFSSVCTAPRNRSSIRRGSCRTPSRFSNCRRQPATAAVAESGVLHDVCRCEIADVAIRFVSELCQIPAETPVWGGMRVAQWSVTESECGTASRA